MSVIQASKHASKRIGKGSNTSGGSNKSKARRGDRLDLLGKKNTQYRTKQDGLSHLYSALFLLYLTLLLCVYHTSVVDLFTD